MPLSEERFNEIREMLSVIEPELKHLSDWQKGFIRDQITRLDQYGQDTFMSDKQITQIRKAYRDVTGSNYGEEEPPLAEPESTRSRRPRIEPDDEIPF